jgi:transposase
MQTDNGKQKGLRTILTERGLWIDGMSRKEALDLLLQQEDFNPDNLSSILDETAKSLGAWLEFVPKFHPEFNFIEMYWGYVKRKVRNECDYDWESLLSHVPLSLDSVPLLFMRKAYTKCCRYIDAYRVGLSATQAEFAVKKYKSHRSIPAEFLRDLK